MTVASVLAQVGLALVSALAYRFIYNLFFHPLAKYPGPWYTAISSFPLALIAFLKREPEFLLGLSKKYRDGDKPIRVSPNLLLFPQASAIKPIYWDPKHNTKSSIYGTGMLGPPNIFTTIDGNQHKILRKAIGGPHWSFGAMKNTWESPIDNLITLFISRMTQFADQRESVILCDKVAQFAADVMAMVCFGETWGFVEKSRDEMSILQSFREGLVMFGFVGRWRSFRENVLCWPLAAKYFLPKPNDDRGMGFLISQADRLVRERERRIQEEGFTQENPDFMQLALEVLVEGRPLAMVDKIAHVTILVMAGADTTGTAMGSTLNYLLTNPRCLAKARAEIDEADAKGLLSTPIQYEESRQHLPYIAACFKEGGLRLRPPATNLFGRVLGQGGLKVGDVFVPAGTEVSSYAYVVQRDPEVFGSDAEEFRPERWLESEEKSAKMDAAMFVFGVGPRVCLGKDIAMFEMYKLLPEILRRFDMELIREGRYIVTGGVAYNEDLVVNLKVRTK